MPARSRFADLDGAGRVRTWVGIGLGVLLLAGGYAGWRALPAEKKDAPPPTPVPVTVARAAKADVPVYLEGIGAVQALNAVEVKPQVGGVLLAVPVREGQEVEKAATLAVIDPRPYQAALDRAIGQRQQDQAQLDNAKLDLQRYSSLAKGDFASRQQVDTQKASVARLQGVIASDDAAVEQARINLGFCVLRSPIAGRIGLRRVDPGNLIDANASGPGILSVVQEHPIAVLFTLPASDLAKIRQAMTRGPVPVLANGSGSGQDPARGRLLTPDNAVNAGSGTISLKAVFDNQDNRLTPGQYVSVRLQSGVARGVAVPHGAIQHGQEALFVYVVKPDDTAERKEVQVAYDDGTTAVLGSSIADGEQVVVSGQAKVGEGVKLASRQQDAGPERSADE